MLSTLVDTLESSAMKCWIYVIISSLPYALISRKLDFRMHWFIMWYNCYSKSGYLGVLAPLLADCYRPIASIEFLYGRPESLSMSCMPARP